MKQHRFRITDFALALALVLTLFASACGSSSATGGKPQMSVLIVKDNPGEQVPTAQQLQQWAKANNVTLSIQVSTLQQLAIKDATVVQSGSGPDVFIMQGYGPQLYANSLLDVSDVAQKIAQEDGGFYDIAKQVGMVNGTWKALPIYIYTHQLIYRKDIFQAIGAPVPTTWTDFVHDAQKIQAKYSSKGMNAFGVAYGRSNDGAQFLQGVLWEYGSKMFSSDGKTVTFDSPQTLAGLNFVLSLYQNHLTPSGLLSWNDSSNNQAVLNGQIATTVNGASIKLQAKSISNDLYQNTGIAVYPAGPDGIDSFASPFSFGIRKNTQHPDLAKSMLEYLFQPSNYSAVITYTGGAVGTSLRGFTNLPVWQNPDHKAILDAVPTAHLTGWPAPPNKVSAEIDSQGILINMLGRVINDHLTPEQAIQEATQKIQALVTSS
jgi:ABC-type glycerol-3-phosphate transport system substrate-binding protein